MDKVRGLLWWLYPEERWLLAVTTFVAIVCMSTGTDFTVNRTITGYRGLFFLNLITILAVARVVLWWRRRHPNPRAWYNLITLDAEIFLMRATAFLMAYIAVYTNIKSRIPILNPAVHDWGLRTFEMKLLGGFDYVAAARGIQAWPRVAHALDKVYHHDYLFMTVMTLVLFLNNGPRHVRHLLTSMGILYLGGVTITVLWPTWGPCFFERGAYLWMEKLDLEAWHSQEMLLRYYKVAVDAGQLATPMKANAFTGIAAFPSLHVGHCMLLVAFARVYAPRLNLLLVPILLLTWLATIVFGWHYISDGIAAIPLVMGSMWLSQRLIFGKEPPPMLDPAGQV